jgi:hypothetical protein
MIKFIKRSVKPTHRFWRGWVVHCPDTNETYYVSVMDLIGKKSMNLRITKSKQ